MSFLACPLSISFHVQLVAVLCKLYAPRTCTAGLDAGDRLCHGQHPRTSPLLSTCCLWEETSSIQHPSFLDLVRMESTGLKALPLTWSSFLTTLTHFIMTESSIKPADRLPEPGMLLTQELIQSHRQKLLTRLEERMNYWEGRSKTHTDNKNPDQDQVASDVSMANAYTSLFPYAQPSNHPPSFRQYTQQNLAQETVKKCHAVSRISWTARQQLDTHRSLVLFFEFARQADDLRQSIKYTEDSHKICGTFWSIVGTVSQLLHILAVD